MERGGRGRLQYSFQSWNLEPPPAQSLNLPFLRYPKYRPSVSNGNKEGTRNAGPILPSLDIDFVSPQTARGDVK